MPVNSMMSLVNQYETPNVRNFSVMQEGVSHFYSPANNLQYVDSPSHMPVDKGSQPLYDAPHLVIF
jgi:hypothetical protein